MARDCDIISDGNLSLSRVHVCTKCMVIVFIKYIFFIYIYMCACVLVDGVYWSSQPFFHLCSQKSQLNFSLRNLTLTELWASHIHLPSSSRDPTLGAFSLIYFSKSLAHQLHGYTRENRLRNWFMSFFWVSSGVFGYCAVIVCKKFHEALPNSFTSGGFTFS